MSKFEPRPYFEISEMTVDDIEPATEMRIASWIDTYTNEVAGVTREWIEARNEVQLSPERALSRAERFHKGKAAGTFMAWVAKDEQGKVIGSTTPFIDADGMQHVGSLYVDKAYHGAGIGGRLMQNVVDWLNPSKPIELMVVAYNDRAKAFYRKWGFEEVPDSYQIAEETIPEVKMIRQPQNTQGDK